MFETIELLDNRVIFDLYQKSQLPSNILFQKQSIFKDSSTNFDKIPIPILFDHEKEAHDCLQPVLYGKSYFSSKGILYKLLGDGS